MIKPKKYQVVENYAGFVKGDVVYDQLVPDYGLANDDTRKTGIEHTTVTSNPDGQWPGKSVPKHILMAYPEVAQSKPTSVTNTHIKTHKP